jgi:hypothetical protein
MFATYMYIHYNICNIRIYLCNIHMKHLQHTSETLETYACSICFQCNISPCYLGEWRLIDAELDTGAELDTAEWHAAPMEKAATCTVEKAGGVVENATANGWPVERKDGAAGGGVGARWRKRGWRPVRRGGEHRGGVVSLEHAVVVRMRCVSR